MKLLGYNFSHRGKEGTEGTEILDYFSLCSLCLCVRLLFTKKVVFGVCLAIDFFVIMSVRKSGLAPGGAGAGKLHDYTSENRGHL